MRIAFLTPEYPTEMPDGGGLGNYLYRFAKLLTAAGHEVEVFVFAANSASFLDDGVLVHRVSMAREGVGYFAYRVAAKLFKDQRSRDLSNFLLRAWSMRRALERRHAIVAFDLVQSADYLATGLLVRRRKDRLHAVRCSSAADLYCAYDESTSSFDATRAKLERAAMRRADLVYSPSSYIANYLRLTHHIDVRVVRPPLHVECKASHSLPPQLPIRFFLHFGQMRERKGTALLARALPIAWESEPDLAMVWSGQCFHPEKLVEWRSWWGNRASQVLITGPLLKPDLYAVLRRAEASVLPSQVDNLPNTVIESLMLGIPVLGSRGASVDELVEDGKTGHLVPLGDEMALGKMMAAMWRGESPVRKGFVWDAPITAEMRPDRAISNLIALLATQPSAGATPSVSLDMIRPDVFASPRRESRGIR